MAGKLILIGGLSRSGKSTLAQQLASLLNKSAYLEQDFFVKPEDELPLIKDRIDWDHPKSIHWESWKTTVKDYLGRYDWVIAEGIFAFESKELNELAHFTIQLSIDKRLFLEERNKELRWGEEPQWFLEHVWTSHLSYQNTHGLSFDMVLSRNQIPELDVMIASIVNKR